MASKLYRDYLTRTDEYRTSSEGSFDGMRRLMNQSMKGCRVAKTLLRGLVLPSPSSDDSKEFAEYLAETYARGLMTESHFQLMLDVIKEDDERIEREKPRILDRFGRLLDIIYKDLKSPKCNLEDFPFAFNIPALIEPGDLEKALKEKNTHLYNIGICCYSQRWHPKLTGFLDVLEKHPIAGESFPTGDIVPHFRENLRILDELGEAKLTDYSTYILAENVGRNSALTLITKPDPYPSIQVETNNASKSGKRWFNVRLKVTPSNDHSIQIGKEYIIPYLMQPERNRRRVELLGYRVPEDEFGRQHIKLNEGSYANYRLYSNPKEIWKIVRDRVSKKMYYAIKERVIANK